MPKYVSIRFQINFTSVFSPQFIHDIFLYYIYSLQIIIQQLQSKISNSSKMQYSPNIESIKNYLNFPFIDSFIQKFQQSPFLLFFQLKNLKNKNKFKKNQSFIKRFQHQINQVLISLNKNSINMSKSMTQTEINKIITYTTIPDQKIRQDLQQIRMGMLKKMKLNLNIEFRDFQTIYNIYKIIYNGSLCNQSQQKKLKSVLTSLKKMMIIQKNSLIKKNSRYVNPYHLNLDIKNILNICQKKLIQNRQAIICQKLRKLRFKQKKTKWIGPKLWQILLQQQWNIEQINILERFIRFSWKQLKLIKSNDKKLQRIIKRMMMNLRSLVDNLEVNNLSINNLQEEENIQMVNMEMFQQNRKINNDLKFEQFQIQQKQFQAQYLSIEIQQQKLINISNSKLFIDQFQFQENFYHF